MMLVNLNCNTRPTVDKTDCQRNTHKESKLPTPNAHRRSLSTRKRSSTFDKITAIRTRQIPKHTNILSLEVSDLAKK